VQCRVKLDSAYRRTKFNVELKLTCECFMLASPKPLPPTGCY